MQRLLKIFLITFYLVAIILPAWVFFGQRGGLSIIAGANFKTLAATLFPLDGLYAFTFLTMQLLVGSNMRRLRPLFPKIMHLHRFHGLLVLFFVILHPSLVAVTYGLSKTIGRQVTTPALQVYVLLAQIAFVIILTTVTTAVMAWKLGWVSKYWRKVHYLNYVAFALLWLHSWFVGADVQYTVLKYVWMVYGLAFLVSLGLRLARAWQNSTNSTLAV